MVSQLRDNSFIVLIQILHVVYAVREKFKVDELHESSDTDCSTGQQSLRGNLLGLRSPLEPGFSRL